MPINLTPEFESLFLKFHRELLNLSYNIVRDRDVAKDIVQEVFEKLWNNKEKVELGHQMKYYLYKATAHTALTHLRNHKKYYRLEDLEELRQIVNQPGSETVLYQEFELKSRQAIDRLPPRCKVIFQLSRHEGLTYPEIAETLGISLKAVENQMGIALKKLRQDLKPYLTLEVISTLIALSSLLYLIFS
jgi:RNA polymerase sigma-70 factor, ECF subfamily